MQANKGVRMLHPVHPGEVVKEEIMPRYKYTVSSLSRAIGIPRSVVSSVVHGKRPLSNLFAIRVELVTGYSAAILVRLQAEYSLSKCRERINA